MIAGKLVIYSVFQKWTPWHLLLPELQFAETFFEIQSDKLQKNIANKIIFNI